MTRMVGIQDHEVVASRTYPVPRISAHFCRHQKRGLILYFYRRCIRPEWNEIQSYPGGHDAAWNWMIGTSHMMSKNAAHRIAGCRSGLIAWITLTGMYSR